MTRTILVAVLGAVGLLAWHLRWFLPASGWESATGWNRVPAADRPHSVGAEAFTLDWLGHAGFVLRWEGVTLLIDPNTDAWCTLARRHFASPSPLPDRVDAVLISHAHYDHLSTRTLDRVAGIGVTLLPAGSEAYLTDAERRHVHPRPVALHEAVRIGPLEVIAVPAAHNGNRFHPLASRTGAVGYIIRSPARTLYVAGDTGLRNGFAALRDRYRPHVAILPIGAYLPSWPLRLYHLSPEDAVTAAGRLGVESVVPCHFGTFTLSLDRPSAALPRFAAAARAAGLAWRMPGGLGEDAER